MAEIRRNAKQMKDLNSSRCDYRYQAIVFNSRSLQMHFEFPRQFVFSFIGLWQRYVIRRSTLLTLDFVQWWIINIPFREPAPLPSLCANIFGVPFRKTDSQSLGEVTSAKSFFNHTIQHVQGPKKKHFPWTATFLQHLKPWFSVLFYFNVLNNCN